MGLYVKLEIWIENQFEYYILVFMFVKKLMFLYMILIVYIVNIKYVMKLDKEYRIDKDNVVCVFFVSDFYLM